MKIWMCCLAGLAILTPLSAGPITVTIGFTGSGTVGATPFTSASMLITATGDTSANTNLCSGCYFMNPTTTTIAITGFPLATVTDSVIIGDNQNASGVYFTTTSDELFVGQAAFATYKLATSLGPLSPTITPLNWPTVSVNTNQGAIKVSGASSATFQAVVGGSSTPEPGSLALVLGGLVALAAYSRSRA